MIIHSPKNSMALISSSALINLGIIASLLFSTTALAANSSKPNHETFLQCLLHHQQIVYTPNTTAYNTVYQSNIQNNRISYSSTAKRPLFIVTPTNELQVQAAVICSRNYDLHIRVRSGGHDYEGMSYVSETDQFILIDMKNLRSIAVDEEHRTAWVQSGAILGELYYTVAKKNSNLAFPAGSCPAVGVGGHFSGGGYGLLSRKYGLAADNIIDAILVDVDGRLLNRETMGEDYFWAIRGGGAASFGVVVSYKIKLVYVPQVVTSSNIIRTLSQNLTEIITKWQNIAPKISENLNIRIYAQAVEIAESTRTILAQFHSFYLGRCKELEEVMNKSFPELGFDANDCNEMSWLESTVFFSGYTSQTTEILLDRRQFNFSFKVKSDYVKQVIASTNWNKIWNFILEAEDEPVAMLIEPHGGKLYEVPDNAIPFPHRSGNLYSIQYILAWNKSETDNAVTERHLSWMRKLYRFMAPFASSNPRAAYINYRDIELGRTGAHTSYSEARIWGEKYFKNNFRRLALVKGKVDPHNFFRNEQSVPPLLSPKTIRQRNMEREIVEEY